MDQPESIKLTAPKLPRDETPEGWIALQALESVKYAEFEHGKTWQELKESDPAAFRKVLVEASTDVIHGIISILFGRVASDVAEKCDMTVEQVTKTTARGLLAIEAIMKAEAGIPLDAGAAVDESPRQP